MVVLYKERSLWLLLCIINSQSHETVILHSVWDFMLLRINYIKVSAKPSHVLNLRAVVFVQNFIQFSLVFFPLTKTT